MDRGRVERLVEDIRSSLMIARDMTSMSYTEFMRDIRNRYTLRLALIEIVEAAADLGLYLSLIHI